MHRLTYTIEEWIGHCWSVVGQYDDGKVAVEQARCRWINKGRDIRVIGPYGQRLFDRRANQTDFF